MEVQENNYLPAIPLLRAEKLNVYSPYINTRKFKSTLQMELTRILLMNR